MAGVRLAREKQVNVHVVPTGTEIRDSVDLAYELFNCDFRRVSRSMREKRGLSDLDVRNRKSGGARLPAVRGWQRSRHAWYR